MIAMNFNEQKHYRVCLPSLRKTFPSAPIAPAAPARYPRFAGLSALFAQCARGKRSLPDINMTVFDHKLLPFYRYLISSIDLLPFN
jgi:hypothetical protein